MEWISNKWKEYWPDISKPIPVKYYWYGAPCIDPDSKPTFDPMLGFPNGRKERKMHMTVEEMERARIPTEHRNYCAHKYVDFAKCYRDTPYFDRLIKKACEPSLSDYKNCLYDIEVMQFKEYERERRLRARQQRRIAKGLEPNPNEIAEAM